MNSNKPETLADLGFEPVNQGALINHRPRRQLMDITPSLGEIFKEFQSRITVWKVIGFLVACAVIYGIVVVALCV